MTSLYVTQISERPQHKFAGIRVVPRIIDFVPFWEVVFF